MKKLHFAFGVITVFFMLSIILEPSLLDNLILMENRYPGYWEYLSKQNTDVRVIKNGNENTENRLIITTDVGTYTYGDLQVTVNEDSSINVSGNNNGDRDIWFEYSRGAYLDNDYYNFYDGEASTRQVHSYVVGRCSDNREITKSDQFDLSQMIEINNDQYDYYIFGIHIAANAKNIGQTFYPMITTNQDKNEKKAAWFSLRNAELPCDTPITVGLSMTQEERSHIADTDFDILKNELRSHYKNTAEVLIEIVAEDGKIEIERRVLY